MQEASESLVPLAAQLFPIPQGYFDWPRQRQRERAAELLEAVTKEAEAGNSKAAAIIAQPEWKAATAPPKPSGPATPAGAPLSRFGLDGRTVEIIVKSFRRFDVLARCVASIRRCYPLVPIIVADDSFRDGEQPPEIVAEIKYTVGLRWLTLPFDVGLAAGRNAAVEAVSAPFVVVVDDDFVFSDETSIEAMVEIVQHGADVCAGMIRGDGTHATQWLGDVEFAGTWPNQRLVVGELTRPWRQTQRGHWYRQTDLAINFFAARTSLLRRIPWDDHFKIGGEHLDWFLTAKQAGAVVTYTPASTVGHIRDGDSDEYRTRRQSRQFILDCCQKWGLVGFPGVQSRQLPEGLAPVSTDTLDLCGLAGRPNLVILGVGHSGTSIVAKMAHRLGWEAGDADDEYGESVSVREINDALIAPDKTAPPVMLRAALAALPQPWAIKDPRFVWTLHHWEAELAPYRPALLWIRRDPGAVAKSHARRGERGRGGLSQDDALSLASRQFAAWTGPKVSVDFESLGDALGLWNWDAIR